MQLELVNEKKQSELESMSKEHLIEFILALQPSNKYLLKTVDDLKKQAAQESEHQVEINGQLLMLRQKVFGKSSEKRPSTEDVAKAKLENPKRSPRKVLPSLRHPDVPLVEVDLSLKEAPPCPCCESTMADMNQSENSEYVTVVKKKFQIIRQKRHKYRCAKCHGAIVTVNAPERIKPGCGYSDEMMIDVAVSKYADLIPVERYARMAAREGLKDIPPHSLIELTHYLADYAQPIDRALMAEVKASAILYADETPHRMLEGHTKSNWYLWGFFNTTASYYLAEPSRAGAVAKNFLVDCAVEIMVSDAYSGYSSATKAVREETGKIIRHSYCNAHARRKFTDAELEFKDEVKPVIDFYRVLYDIEEKIRDFEPELKSRTRQEESVPIWRSISAYLMTLVPITLPKSALGKALAYWFKHEAGLKIFLSDGRVPIDNNLSERQLRTPVVGRKTWYGNHSPRGAKTSATLFSIMQSCRMNLVNPYDYLEKAIREIRDGVPPSTPRLYSLAQK